MSKLQTAKMFISKTTGRGGLLVRKHSPEILMTVGIAGIIVSTVLACRATLKAEGVIETAKQKFDMIHEAKKLIGEKSYMEDQDGKAIDYTQQDYQKDLLVTYVQTGVDFIKLYGPAVTLGIISIGCMLGAQGIMRKRNIALMAAYKAVEQSFSDYRKRVVAELGVDKDRHYRYGSTELEVVEPAYTDADGIKHKAKKVAVEVLDPTSASQYAKFFDSSSSEWSETPDYNMMFLKCQQQLANDLLQSRGHIFLNEVYDMLGIPRTTPGAVVGWLKGEGDDFVDFGMFETNVHGYTGDSHCDTISEERRDFVNGYRPSILLDFNVCGVIHDKI